MSSISYRSWDIWINLTFFEREDKYDGYYACTIFPTLMTQQTIVFLAENYDIHKENFIEIQKPPAHIVTQNIIDSEGQLSIKIYDVLDTRVPPIDNIKRLCEFLDSVSLCVDSTLLCNKITFYSHNYGALLIANRRPIGRGVSFEVEERGQAKKKIQLDNMYFFSITYDNFKIGRKHYLTGLTLLGLEDQVSGLIDAAFMQFYQGCEALCRDPKGNIENSKKYIASCNLKNGRELQIIAHHVWRVRHKYFGHGDVSYNILANSNLENATQVAKQVLVARYLCKQLLEIKSPSGEVLIREMGLFSKGYTGNFTGDIFQLENDFRVDYDLRNVKIYNEHGICEEEYTIK